MILPWRRGCGFYLLQSCSYRLVGRWIGLARGAAKELAEQNIRVNTVNPSPVETQMMRRLETGMNPEDAEQVHENLKTQIPLGRYAEADDIAKVMLFLE